MSEGSLRSEIGPESDGARAQSEERPYWDRFYAGQQATAFPSQFACMVASCLGGRAAIVDLGCGNGRDSFFLAQLGNPVLGVDQSKVAVGSDSDRARAMANPPEFHLADFHAGSHLFNVVSAFVRRNAELQRVFYCRFVIHAISDDIEQALFEVLHPLFRPGDRFFAEFRTKEDADKPKIFGGHFRRFVDLQAFLDRSVQRGFRVDYAIKGVGMATYKSEDPTVARVILSIA